MVFVRDTMVDVTNTHLSNHLLLLKKRLVVVEQRRQSKQLPLVQAMAVVFVLKESVVLLFDRPFLAV